MTTLREQLLNSNAFKYKPIELNGIKFLFKEPSFAEAMTLQEDGPESDIVFKVALTCLVDPKTKEAVLEATDKEVFENLPSSVITKLFAEVGDFFGRKAPEPS